MSNATGLVLRLRNTLVWAALLFPAIAASANGCAEGEEALPAALPPGAGDDGLAESCAGDERRPCYVTLGRRDGTLTCYEGTQTCHDGAWGECTDGRTYPLSAKGIGEASRGLGEPTAELRPQALSAAANCDFNPCNPYCRHFNEVPDGGIIPIIDAGPDTPGAINNGPSVPYDWVGGTYTVLPPATIDLAFHEPCTSGADCQLNTYCRNPSSGSCAHHVCEEGPGLDPDCSECVTAICTVDADCCGEPASACVHSPCLAGAALAAACDPCVTAVCAAMPGCCTGVWDSSCVAQIAASCPAAPINKSCECGSGEAASGGHCYVVDPNDKSWTDARTDCRARGPGWDLAAIESSAENSLLDSLPQLTANSWVGGNDRSTEGRWRWVDSATGSQDGPRFWDNGSTGSSYGGAYENWASGEPSTSSSSRDCAYVTSSGAWYGRSCSDAHEFVCEGPPSVLAGTSTLPSVGWDADCVEQVASVCGARCGEGEPPPSDGICTPWYPDELDPTCADFDLTVSVGCEDSGAPIVTLCNHGQTEAPAGIDVVHWPSGASDFGAQTPDTAATTGAERCTTAEAVPRGWCINVYGCFSGSPEGREIMVNPRDGTEAADECHFFDNWGVFNVSECGTPVCSGNASAATLRPLNMYFVVDKSGSMDYDVPTRWGATSSAMKAFFADPGSAPLRVAINFFPSSNCAPDDSTCDPTLCREPVVTLGELAEARAPLDGQEQSLFDALAIEPDGGTPTYPALRGALEWLREQQLQRPNEEYVVVLATDGEPNWCSSNVTNLTEVASEYFDDYGIRTYVIGIEGVAESTIQSIAEGGGGADQAFMVTATGGGSVADQLVDALQSIAEHAVSCDFDLPNQGAFDPELATVSYIASQPPAALSPGCLADQVEFGGHCYYVTQDATTWEAALANCRLMGPGWDLASVIDAAEDAFVIGVVQSELDTDAWIGLSSLYGGAFLWSNGQTTPTTHWDTGQPTTDACVRVDESTGAWDSVACDGTYRYVCEGPLTGDTDQCALGELEGPDGACYFVDPTARTWSTARTACQNRRAGWDLATVASAEENAVSTVAAAGSAIWIAATDSTTEGLWRWSDGTAFFQILPPACRSGELEGPNGNCFYVDTTARSWASAQTACAARGTSWNLAALRSSSINAFVQDAIGADVWVGGNDRSTEGNWRWPDNTQFWSGAPASTGCATGQSLFAGNGRCYRRETTNRNWANAQTFCRGLGTGWDLTAIENAAENTFVDALLSGTSWIGGSDNVFSTEGRWYWPDGVKFWQSGSSANLYSNWAASNPLTTAANTEDCVDMTTSGTWRDTTCTTSQDHVCEGPAIPTGGSAVGGQYVNWAASEPDNAEGSGSGDCMRLHASDGRWEDWGCDTALAAVCEGPKTPMSAPIGGAYVNWDAAEPNDGGGNSDCALIYTDGTWRDSSCTSTYRPVCRGPKPAPPAPPAPRVGGLLTSVASSASCAAGSDAQWYFDDAGDPTLLSVCSATCDRIKQDRRAKLAIEIGCYPPAEPPPERQSWVAPQSETQIYRAECVNEVPQWDMLAYNTVTPGGSSVDFSVRVAGTEAELASQTFTSVATAHASPTDTQVCGLGGPPPCPISLYDALGMPDAAAEFLELKVTVNPGAAEGGADAIANSWRITYSCPPSF